MMPAGTASSVRFDVLDPSDVWRFSITVNGNSVGPIDVSGATSGNNLAQILNVDMTFGNAGLIANWSSIPTNILTITDDGIASFTNPSLTILLGTEVDSDGPVLTTGQATK